MNRASCQTHERMNGGVNGSAEPGWFEKNKKNLARAGSAAAVLALLYLVFGDLISTLKPFFYSLAAAFLLNPLVRAADRKKVRRAWSSLAAAVMIMLLLALFFALIVPSVVSDAARLVRQFPRGLAYLREQLSAALEEISAALADMPELKAQTDELIAGASEILSGALKGFVSSLGGLFHVFLVPVITFYLLKDKEKLIAAGMALVPPARREALTLLGKDVRGVLRNYVRGRLFVSLIVGLATGLGCLFLGLPSALTIGILAGLLDLIPYFGPWLGGVLPVVLALSGDAPVKALWVILMILLIQQAESNLITPRVISESVGIHPLLVMFSVMFFGSLMGITGMIVGVPVTASLLALARRFRKTGRQDGNGAADPPLAPVPSPPGLSPAPRKSKRPRL